MRPEGTPLGWVPFCLFHLANMRSLPHSGSPLDLMHRFGFLPIFLVTFVLMLAGASAQDFSDLFLGAYQDFQTAEKLEREGKPREALAKYGDAEKTLQQIRKEGPEWQPLVVDFRLKKTNEGIARLQVEVAKLPPPVEGIEGPMPEADRETTRRPAQGGGPVVVAPRSSPATGRTTADLGVPSGDTGGADRELRRLRQQLQDAKEENSKMARKLEDTDGQLKMVLVTLDKTKVSLVEAKSALAQANSALENQSADRSDVKALRAEFDKKASEVVKQLATAQSDQQVLEEENKRLLAKLEDAAKYIQSSDSIREGLLKDRTKLEGDRDAAVQKAKKVKDNTAEVERVTGENKDLKTKLAAAEKAAGDSDKAAKEAEKATQQARKATEDAQKAAQTAEGLAQAKTADAEKLLQENKVLTNRLAEALVTTPSKEDLDKLVAERNTLQAKLAQLEKAKNEAPPAAAPDPEKDRQIASLQSDLNTANDRLLEAQAQASQSDDKVRALQKQLDQTTGELAQLKINPVPSKEQTNLIAENELLRNIIMRQIKEQPRREEATKAIVTALAPTSAKDEGLRSHLAVLAEPALQLTDAERAIFREPVSLVTQPGGEETLGIAVAVTKPTSAEARRARESKAKALPEEARGQFEKAKKLFEAQDFAGAEKVFQTLAETAPDNYYILSNLGAVQIESGKLSAAEVALKKAVQINESDSYAHRNLGIVYSRQGKIDAAIEALRRSVTADDKDKIAHNYLGVCLGQKENMADAEKEFKRAIAIDPKYSAAHFNLAVLYATKQPPEMPQAKEHYQKAIQLGAPPDPSLDRLIQ